MHDSFKDMGEEFRRTHGTPPTPIEAPAFVANEVEKLAGHPILAGSSDTIEFMKPAVIGEVLQASEAMGATQQLPLKSYNAFVTQGELQPFGHRVAQMRHGHIFEGDILASISVDPAGRRCEIVRDIEGKTSFVVIDGDDKVNKLAPLEKTDGALKVGGGELLVSQAEQAWSIEFRQSPGAQPHDAVLSIAESMHATDLKSIRALETKERKRQNRNKWIRRAVGVAAIYATLTPGGLIDIAHNSIVGTQATVQTSVQGFTPETDSPESIAEWAKIQTAGMAVEQTMEDLDVHQYQSVLDRAAEFKVEHAAEFLSANAIDETFDQIETAQTKEEVVAALADVSAFYGYSFEVSDAVSLDASKNTAGEIVKSLTILPTSLTNQAALKTIMLQTMEEVAGDDAGSDHELVGRYRSGEESIRIGSVDTLGSVLKQVSTTIPGSYGGYTVGSVFMHEFSHALNEGSSLGVADERAQVGEDRKAANIIEDIVVGGVLDSPQFMSTYARASTEESIAENLSGIFTDRSDGLAHPDESRSYTSPANVLALMNLVQLEANTPGLADYLVAQNDRLMRGQTL